MNTFKSPTTTSHSDDSIAPALASPAEYSGENSAGCAVADVSGLAGPRDADQLLLARLAGRDLAALADAYAYHGPALAELATRVVGDVSRAQEVVYDGFLDAWDQAQSADMSHTTVFNWLAGRVMCRATARAQGNARAISTCAVADLQRVSATL